MTSLKILVAPDDRLNKVSTKIKKIEKETLFLIENMVETMYKNNGIGLAAPQVGELSRVLVMDCGSNEKEDKLMRFINPKVINYSQEVSEYEEGCLSLPNQFAKIIRPSKIKVSYLDLNGETIIKEFQGLEATCLQHEIDHLNGKLFIDHISKLRKNIILKKLKKYKKLNNL